MAQSPPQTLLGAGPFAGSLQDAGSTLHWQKLPYEPICEHPGNTGRHSSQSQPFDFHLPFPSTYAAGIPTGTVRGRGTGSPAFLLRSQETVHGTELFCPMIVQGEAVEEFFFIEDEKGGHTSANISFAATGSTPFFSLTRTSAVNDIEVNSLVSSLEGISLGPKPLSSRASALAEMQNSEGSRKRPRTDRSQEVSSSPDDEPVPRSKRSRTVGNAIPGDFVTQIASGDLATQAIQTVTEEASTPREVFAPAEVATRWEHCTRSGKAWNSL
ncbi:hypothetical protein NM688_g5173 [Phlebia brevispora]|uniref:Uncharacterized protein n=1 Tax=Phlebia brevispora TaxID=194682 RepID=A0ACC1SZF1_9APHY|nr:hypothetical protein NM688_g5173 [Phlebia brevispora]